MRIIGIRHTTSTLATAIAMIEKNKRVAIVNNLIKLLSKGFGVKLERTFSTNEGWEDLINYLVFELSLRVREDTSIALEWLNNKSWIATYENAGAIGRQYCLPVSHIVAIGRRDPALSQLLLAICSHLVRVNGVGLWDTGALWTSDQAVCSLEDTMDQEEEISIKDLRDKRKSISRYSIKGIATRYSDLLQKMAIGKGVKIVKSVLHDGNSESDVKKLCEAFIKVSKINESLGSYRQDRPTSDDDDSEAEPVPLSHSFILYWRNDKVQDEINDIVNMHFNEGGLEEVFLKSVLVDQKGYSARIKDSPQLPKLLSNLFLIMDKVIDNRIRAIRNGRKVRRKRN